MLKLFAPFFSACSNADKELEAQLAADHAKLLADHESMKAAHQALEEAHAAF